MKYLSSSKTKIFFSYLISCIFLAGIFALSLLTGAEKINLQNLFNNDSISFLILFKLRLPRSLLVFISGFLMAGAGAVFQLFFRNSLAEPGIMGISAGATLGAVSATALGFSSAVAFISPVNIWAFAGALISGFVVTLLATGKSSKESSIMLLLCGTALGTLYSAISSIILLTKSNEIRSIYAWTLGSFNGRGWNELLFILIPSVLSIVIMFVISPMLDLLTGGEDSAESLGLNLRLLRILVLICGAFACSSAVCAGGTINFIGLIAPHIVRKIIGPKAKNLIPFSMIFGGILLLLADTLARTLIAPAELPTGILTAILGVPFFISLCLRYKKM